MTTALREALAVVAAGSALSAAQTEAAFAAIMQGDATPAQVGGLLIGLCVRGETVEELTGAAKAMRASMVPAAAPDGAVDTCGTGGDMSGTFNVSTAVMFVVAGCGVPVAKHGNRAVSSRSGTADVLEALGVNIDAPIDPELQRDGECGVSFLFAPNYHASTRHAAPARRELGVRTIFNLLGPLANPAAPRRQLLGVFARRWVVPMAEVLRALGSERAWVVHGHDGLDELTTTTRSSVAELRDGVIREFEIDPEAADLPHGRPSELVGGDAAHNAAALRALLNGQANGYRDIVVLNAAAALIVAGKAGDLRHGAELAGNAIDSGAAVAQLHALVRATNRVFA